MKELLKNKKFLIICGCVGAILIVGLILGFIFWPDKEEKDPAGNTTTNKENTPITETHTMIVSINPLVKLVYEQTYTECEDNNGEKYLCSDISNEVIAYELQNDDSKEIYKDLDFTGKDLYDVIITLCDTARDNDIGFTELTITTDDDYVTMEEIQEVLKTESKYKTEYTVYVELEEYIDPKVEGSFKVTFNSDGGTKVSSQVVSEGDTATEPAKPTKAGYTFKEWRLDGKKYDFKTKVTKDIFLKAVWTENKKEETTTPSTGGSTNTPVVPDNTQTETPVVDTSESRIEKINLNENILFNYSSYSYGGYCGSTRYLMFATNLETLFPGKVKTSSYSWPVIEVAPPGAVEQFEKEYQEYGTPYDLSKYVLEADWLAQMPNITYDAAKEANLVSVFDSLTRLTPPGIKPFTYDFSDHKLTSYYFTIIKLAEPDKFPTLNKSLQDTKNSLATQIDNAVAGMYDIIYVTGGCGGDSEPMLLNEEYCAEFNLNCARW